MSMQTGLDQEKVTIDPTGDDVIKLVEVAFDVDRNIVQALARLSAATAMVADMIGCPEQNVIDNLLLFAADIRALRSSDHPANATANRGH